jgi:hypothetical protein
MAGNSIKHTVLEFMLKLFKKGFSGDYRIKVSPGMLCTLCESECPIFGINWPLEGTLDLPMVRAIYQMVIGNPGYPTSFHILTPGSSWLRQCPVDSDSVLIKREREEFS